MPNNDELNLEGLDEIFNDTDEIDRQQFSIDFETEIDYDDALDALKKNIHNANQLLSKIQSEMNAGNFSARLAEVTATIINSITQASKEVIADKNYGEYMIVRKALVQLKAKELEIKEMQGLNKPAAIKNQTNVLVTNREDLLKVLQSKKPNELIEYKNDEENKNEPNG